MRSFLNSNSVRRQNHETIFHYDLLGKIICLSLSIIFNIVQEFVNILSFKEAEKSNKISERQISLKQLSLREMSFLRIRLQGGVLSPLNSLLKLPHAI